MARKKEKPPPSDGPDLQDRVSRLIDAINKQAGGTAVVRRASDVARPYHIRRPTGITSLDLALKGGFPAATLCQIFGPESAGKSYLADLVMAQAQQIYGDHAAVAVGTFGYGYDKRFGIQNGVAVPLTSDELAVLEEERGGLTDEERDRATRKVGEFIEVSLGSTAEALEKPAESVLGVMLDIIQSGMFQVVVFDEANLGQTKADAKKSMGEDPKQAALATLLSRFVSRFFNALASTTADGRENQTTVLMILEARADLNASSGPSRGPFKARPALRISGGHALRHTKAIDVHLTSLSKVREGDDLVGKEVKFEIKKGKMGLHEGAHGKFLYRFDTGVDIEADLVGEAAACGVLSVAGSYYKLGSETLGQGMGNVADRLRDNRELFQHLRAEVFRAHKLTVRYT